MGEGRSCEERRIDEEGSSQKGAWRPPSVIRWIALGGVGVLAIGYLLAVPLGVVDPKDRLSTPEVILGGVLLIGLAFADQLREVNELKWGPLALSIRQVKAEQAQLASDFEKFTTRVNTLFLTALAGSVFNTLSGLADGKRPYDQNHREDLIRELTLLRDLGYIGDFNAHEIPPSGDLGRKIPVTQNAREFIRLRNEVEKLACQAR